jgi:anti-anti-sigma factor
VIERNDIDGTCVIRFTRPQFAETEAEAAFGSISNLVEGEGCRKLVLNLAPMQSFTSKLLGQLVVLNTTAQRTHARLALCSLSPEAGKVLDVTGLGQLFTVFGTEGEAIKSLSSEDEATMPTNSGTQEKQP